jgi:hypothetical protein
MYKKIIIILLVLILAPAAYAGNNTCTIKASRDLEYIRVFDVDSDGNIKYGYSTGYCGREILVVGGPLKQGTVVEVKSSNGTIIYNYKSVNDNLPFGGFNEPCDNNRVITIP